MAIPWLRRGASAPAGGPAGPALVADRDLLTRVRAKDEAALEALYDRYGGLVYTLARRIVGDRHLAQEVMQDTFLRCWDGAERYDPARGRVAEWLMGIARNRAIDLLRSRQHQARLREREPLPPTAAAGRPARTEQGDPGEAVLLREVLSAALQTLPAAQRHAIELAYYGGLTQPEIARALGEPLGTVKTRIRDGMERLRRHLWPVVESERGEVEHRG